MSTRFVFAAVFLLVLGCEATFYSRNGLPASEAQAVKRCDSPYLSKAAAEAAFVANCPSEQVVASPVTWTHARYRTGTGAFMDAERIETIGIEACGQRFTYKVLCSQTQYYCDHERSDRPNSCEVVKEGSNAQSRVEQVNEEAVEERARAAREAQQKPQ